MKDALEWAKGQLISIIITACLTLGTNGLYRKMTGSFIEGWTFALLPIFVLLLSEVFISLLQIKPHRYKSYIEELSIFFEYCGEEIFVTKKYRVRALRRNLNKIYHRITWFSDEKLEIKVLTEGFFVETIPNNDMVREFYIVFPRTLKLFETIDFEFKIRGKNKGRKFKNYYWYDVIAPTGKLKIDVNVASKYRENRLVLKEFRENMDGNTLREKEVETLGNYTWFVKRPKLNYSYVVSWKWKILSWSNSMKETEQTGYSSIDKPWLKYYSEEELNIEVPSYSIYENMYRHANGNSNEIAIEYMGRKTTYKELFFNIDKVARALKAVGVCKGDVVSVCLPNIPEALYLFYAINRIGAVANMLDVRSGGPTLKKAIVDAESKVLFYLDSIVDKLVDIKKNTLVEIVVAVAPIDSFPRLAQFIIRRKRKELRQNIPKEVISWTKFIEKCHGYSENVDAEVDENVPAVIAYTGGTTGEPKGVIGTNKNVNAVAEMEFRVGFNQREHDSILCMAPPWTYYGLCNSVHVPLCMGLKVILLPKFEADELADLVLKLQPNHVVTVPSALNAFFQSKYDKSDFSCLHSLIVGADKLDESLEKDMNDFLYNHSCEIKVSKGYGMTEVMAAAAYSRLNANEIGSVGIPYPLNTITAFRETDEGFEECKIGEQGEIAILGPTVMKSYFGKFKQENTEILKVHDDGTTWAHTGDIGYIGEDGRVYIVGRLKRMFVRMGFKVFPATIEHCILENEDVQMAAVVPIKEIAHGYCIKAYIVRKNPNADSEKIKKEIINKLSEELYEYELPDVYEFVDELPLTGMGKVDYRALEEL